MSASRSPWKQEFRKTPRGGLGSASFRFGCLQVEANQRPDLGLPFRFSWRICLHPPPANNSKRHHNCGCRVGTLRKKRDRPGPCSPALLQREHHCHGPENTHPLYPSRDRLLHRRRDCEPASALHSSVQYVRYVVEKRQQSRFWSYIFAAPLPPIVNEGLRAPYEDLGNPGSTWNPPTSTLPRRPSPASAMVLIT